MARSWRDRHASLSYRLFGSPLPLGSPDTQAVDMHGCPPRSLCRPRLYPLPSLPKSMILKVKVISILVAYVFSYIFYFSQIAINVVANFTVLDRLSLVFLRGGALHRACVDTMTQSRSFHTLPMQGNTPQRFLSSSFHQWQQLTKV